MIWIFAAVAGFLLLKARAVATGEAAPEEAGLSNGQTYSQNPSTAQTPGATREGIMAPYTAPGNVPVRATAFWGANFRNDAYTAAALALVRNAPAGVNTGSAVHPLGEIVTPSPFPSGFAAVNSPLVAASAQTAAAAVSRVAHTGVYW